jgi:predicted glycosyl hydrolase (DUF1957 family)
MADNRKITIQVSPVMASCLQRMLSHEIGNQVQWKKEDAKNEIRNEIRDAIIQECKDICKYLYEQGFPYWWQYDYDTYEEDE